MKKKSVLIRIDEALYFKIKESSKNQKSFNQTVVNLIEKGLIKNKNDYAELINFLSKNIVTKINKEFTDYRYFLRKLSLNNSAFSSSSNQKNDNQNDDRVSKAKTPPEQKSNFFDLVDKSLKNKK